VKEEGILVIEDENRLSRLLADLLEFEGYRNIQIANNGYEGVEKYKQTRPQVVFMDLEMPVMNGYDSSKAIKKYDPGANIILITANPGSPFARKILDEGYVSQVIPKPFRCDDLFAVIRKSIPPPSTNT